MKILLWVGAIIVLAVGGFYAFNNYGRFGKEMVVGQQLTHKDFVWRIENAPKWEETMPRHSVYLEVQGKSYKAGESIGCNIKQDALEPNEITRKTCWFGGGGDVYSVFFENGSYTLKHRWMQESGGPEVNTDPEGGWETVLKIN
jgi:hypothetical protein